MAAKKWDWPVLHAEYMSGVSMAEISRKYGVPYNTLMVTATRKKWSRDRDKNCQLRTEIVCKSVNDSLASQAKEFTRIVTNGLISASKDLFQREIPQDPYEANALAGAMDKVNNMGRKTFGLDAQAASTTINIKLMSDMAPEQVIDVQSVSDQSASVGQIEDKPKE